MSCFFFVILWCSDAYLLFPIPRWDEGLWKEHKRFQILKLQCWGLAGFGGILKDPSCHQLRVAAISYLKLFQIGLRDALEAAEDRPSELLCAAGPFSSSADGDRLWDSSMKDLDIFITKFTKLSLFTPQLRCVPALQGFSYSHALPPLCSWSMHSVMEIIWQGYGAWATAPIVGRLTTNHHELLADELHCPPAFWDHMVPRFLRLSLLNRPCTPADLPASPNLQEVFPFHTWAQNPRNFLCLPTHHPSWIATTTATRGHAPGQPALKGFSYSHAVIF